MPGGGRESSRRVAKDERFSRSVSTGTLCVSVALPVSFLEKGSNPVGVVRWKARNGASAEPTLSSSTIPARRSHCSSPLPPLLNWGLGGWRGEPAARLRIYEYKHIVSLPSARESILVMVIFISLSKDCPSIALVPIILWDLGKPGRPGVSRFISQLSRPSLSLACLQHIYYCSSAGISVQREMTSRGFWREGLEARRAC